MLHQISVSPRGQEVEGRVRSESSEANLASHLLQVPELLQSHTPGWPSCASPMGAKADTLGTTLPCKPSAVKHLGGRGPCTRAQVTVTVTACGWAPTSPKGSL